MEEIEEIKYMPQGTVNGRRTARARHIEALDQERRIGRVWSIITLIIGAVIGSGITCYVVEVMGL